MEEQIDEENFQYYVFDEDNQNQNQNFYGQPQKEKHKFLVKVYTTVFIMLFITAAIYFFFRKTSADNSQQRQGERPRVHNQDDNQNQGQQNEPNLMPGQVKITDKTQRKISISARDLLIEASTQSELTQSKYTLNIEMVEFIRAIKHKYRIYLLTRFEQQDARQFDVKDYEQINELLMKLVKQDIIKGKQRLMYSSSEAGHIAQIRHLAADLHLENDFKIVKNLAQFMKKFHYVNCFKDPNSEEAVAAKQEIQDLVRQNVGKVLYFQDVLSYTSKIKSALSK